ncbi:hypothetical protein DAMA08_022430 [Martiniozyma asiatica (nom. inval.)]|nr:hypothetical protein DAMA08_022430 [Martiniozyma asiatica]
MKLSAVTALTVSVVSVANGAPVDYPNETNVAPSFMQNVKDTISGLFAPLVAGDPEAPGTHRKKHGKAQKKHWKKMAKGYKKNCGSTKDVDDSDNEEELSDDDEADETPAEEWKKHGWKKVGKDQKKHWKKVGKGYKKKYGPPTDGSGDVILGDNVDSTPGEDWKKHGKGQKKHWKKVGKGYKKKFELPADGSDSDNEEAVNALL